MTRRAMWKAEIQLGEQVVPVKMYAAIEDRKVHFHLLEAESETQVAQQLVDAVTEDPIENKDARRGVQVDASHFVVLSDDELKSLEPPESRAITVERCVPGEAVSEVWYERPYWLGPDGDDAAYAAIVKALSDSGRVAVVHWVMRKKRYHGALRPRGEHLLLMRLRRAGEVVSAGDLVAPKGRAADAKELKLAEQLVGALEGPFDPSELADTYQARVRELVEAKAAGEVIPLAARRPKKAPSGSLAETLRASLSAIRAGKAKKSKGVRHG